MNWTEAVLLVALLINLACFLAVAWSIIKVKSIFTAFILPPDASSPSPMAQVWSLACHQLVTQMKVTIMGMMSGEARAAKKLAAEAMTAEIAGQAPAISAVLDFVPGARKMLNKSPGLAQYILSRLPKPEQRGELPAGENVSQVDKPQGGLEYGETT